MRDERLSRRDDVLAFGIGGVIALVGSVPAMAIGLHSALPLVRWAFQTVGIAGFAWMLICLIKLVQVWSERPYRLATLPRLHLARKYERRVDGNLVRILDFGSVALATDAAGYAACLPNTLYRVGRSTQIDCLTYVEPLDPTQGPPQPAALAAPAPMPRAVPLRLDHIIHLLFRHAILPTLAILAFDAFIGWLIVAGEIPAPWGVLLLVIGSAGLLMVRIVAKEAIGDVLSGVAEVDVDRLLGKRRVIVREEEGADEDGSSSSSPRILYEARFARTGTRTVSGRIFRQLVVEHDHWIIASPLTNTLWDIVPVAPQP